MRSAERFVAAAVVALVTITVADAQQAALPSTLTAMANAERAFAMRATVVGWKQAFLEFFADDSIGFDGDKTVPAKDQLRQIPDPPKDVQLLWEPRYGDVAASGELGWLTGPSTSINPARNNGAPRYGNYASIWKRQPNGDYKVLIDVGINLPMAAPFAPGFTRAPSQDRYQGNDSVASATAALRAADTTINEASQLSLATAFTGQLAPGARLHRTNVMPLTDTKAILAFLETQPAWTAGQQRFADVAASRDLGYTYGTYATAPDPARTAAGRGNSAPTAEKGFYTRVWTRGRDGVWKVALDVLQPQ